MRERQRELKKRQTLESKKLVRKRYSNILGAHIYLITQVKATGKRIKCWTRLFRTGALNPLKKREKHIDIVIFLP